MKFSKRFRENMMLVVLGVVLFFVLTNYKLVLNILDYIKNILYPVMLGGLFAFILNVPMSAIERTIFRTPKKEKPKKVICAIKRPCSIVLTLLIAIGILSLLLVLVIPSLAKTLSTLSESAQAIVDNISEKVESNGALKTIFNAFNIKKDSFTTGLMDFLKDSVSALKSMNSPGSAAAAIFSSIINVVLGIFFSIYFLAQKEKLKEQARKVCVAFLPARANSKVTRIGQRTVDTFGKFLTGQCTDAALLGTLCSLGMLLFGFPYPLLIGVVVAVAALIPVLGSCIGMAIGFLLISATSITQAVWFVVFLLILIQIDCNFIYPRIVGNSVGLPALWVLFAVTVGGRMWGVLGMFLAVPACAIVYSALTVIVNERYSKTIRLRNIQHSKKHRKKRFLSDDEDEDCDEEDCDDDLYQDDIDQISFEEIEENQEVCAQQENISDTPVPDSTD
ncbi:AI-2E family transporter [Ruminococcus sp. FC2018]|uniref:AI-2E family transporter n=1 Tax=Ruminococcus sp. FC2018 TaxID=1410617 RepID=UPI000491B10C|nr:AI-2E family transporter [Ruminococcus sp. FC2018]